MDLGETVRNFLRSPLSKIGGLVLGGTMLLSPLAKAQEVNTTDSLLWKKQAIEQTILNEHNNKPIPHALATYTLLDTTHAPSDLRIQTFQANQEGVFTDSVWTEIINPDYISPVDTTTAIGDVSSNNLTEELKLLFDGAEYKFVGTTAIEPKTISIISMNGGKIFLDKIENYDPGTFRSEKTFSLDNLAPGPYILNINNNPLYSLKFLKLQDGVANYGVAKQVEQPDFQGTLKSAKADSTIQKSYERLFENTEEFIFFPAFKDTIAIQHQDENFQTTTSIPDVKYLYDTKLKATPGATVDISFQGNDTTNFSLDVPADSVVVVPQVYDEDDEVVLAAKEDKLGWDADSASWTLPFGENFSLELYIQKTKLPHSFAGGAYEGTNIVFTLPDTTLTTIADENNQYKTDTIWRTDSTFYGVLAYATLRTFPAIIDTFDAPFGEHNKDFFVDTTMNGFNLMFKGYPQTHIRAENSENGDLLFDGTIAQDSLARAPAYRSLEDTINLTIDANLAFYHDSTFSMNDVLAGVTLQEILLRRKTYDFAVNLQTNPYVMVTGLFGGNDIDTLYTDAEGKVALPSQTFFQPDSLQDVNLKLEREFFADKNISFTVNPGQNNFETYLDSLYYDFDVGITTQPAVRATGMIGGKDVGEVYADEQGKLWLPQQQFAQPDSLQDVNLKLEREFFADKDLSFTIKPDTTLLEQYLDTLEYTFDVRVNTTPYSFITGSIGGVPFGTKEPLYSDAQGYVWLPQLITNQPDSLQQVVIDITRDGYYDETETFTIKPDTTIYDVFLQQHRYAHITGIASREDSVAIGPIDVFLKNINDSTDTHYYLPVDSTFTIDDILLPREGSTSYELKVSKLNAPAYVGSYIDTLDVSEEPIEVHAVLPVIPQLVKYNVVVKDGNTQAPLRGVRVRALSKNGDLWDSEVTAADGTATLEHIPLGVSWLIEYGYKEDSSRYFVNLGDLQTPAEITYEGQGDIDLPLLLYSKTQPVPGTYNASTQQSDSVDISSDEIKDILRYNYELFQHRPVYIHCVWSDIGSISSAIAAVDDLIQQGDSLFDLDGLIQHTTLNYQLTPADLTRYEESGGEALQDSVNTRYAFGSLNKAGTAVVIIDEQQYVVYGGSMELDSGLDGFLRAVYGDLIGLAEVQDRPDSFMEPRPDMYAPFKSPTPKDRALVHFIYQAAWNKNYYSTATFYINNLKETMFDWVDD